MKRLLPMFFACVLLLSTTGLAQTEVVTIRLLHGWDGTRLPLMQEMLDDFQAQYPWFQVETELTPLGDHRIEKFLVAVASGTPPDVVMIDQADLPSFVSMGVLHSLDPFIERDGIDLGMFYEPEIISSQYAGSTYALPMATAGAKQLLYYNLDIIEEMGVSQIDMPRTWDELERVARKLTQRDLEGNLTLLGFNPLHVPDAGWDFWLYSNGGQALSDDARTVTVNTDRAFETVDWLTSFVNEINGGISAMNQLGDVTWGGLLTQRMALSLGGSWEWFRLRATNPELRLGIAMPPAGAYGEPVNLVDKGWAYAIPAGVANPDASWELLKWLTIEESAAGWFMQEQGRPSPVRAFNLGPELEAANPYLPVIGEALEAGYVIPVTPIHTRLFGRIRQVPHQVLNERLGIREVLEETQRAAQIMLDEMWAER